MPSLKSHVSTGLAWVNNLGENTPVLFYLAFWLSYFKHQVLHTKREMIRKETFWTYSTDQNSMFEFWEVFFPSVTNMRNKKDSLEEITLSSKEAELFLPLKFNSQNVIPPYTSHPWYSKSELDNDNCLYWGTSSRQAHEGGKGE